MLFYTLIVDKVEALFKACEENDTVEIIRILKSESADMKKLLLGAADQNNWNCLHFAAWNSNFRVIGYLMGLKEYLDVRAKTDTGASAFSLAMKPRRRPGHEDERYPPIPTINITKMLCMLHPNFAVELDEENMAPLEVARKYHHRDVEKALLELKNDISGSSFWLS